MNSPTKCFAPPDNGTKATDCSSEAREFLTSSKAQNNITYETRSSGLIALLIWGDTNCAPNRAFGS